MRVYTPDEYFSITKHCRKKNPLEVIKMQAKYIEKCIVNRKVDIDGAKNNWLKTKEILRKKKVKGRLVQLLTEALSEKFLWPNR